MILWATMHTGLITATVIGLLVVLEWCCGHWHKCPCCRRWFRCRKRYCSKLKLRYCSDCL